MAGKVVEGPVIGIDLGTTYSCVAVWRQNRVEIIPNDQGNRTTPSCVAFTDNERLIGEAAVNQATKNPLNTIFDVKRLIGRRFSESDMQKDMKLWPFKVIDGIDFGKVDMPMIVVKYRSEEKKFTPEEISGIILAKMKAVAEAFLGSTVKNAVVTVPAYFNDSQRRATKDAGTIAGLNVVRIINEPTAAAMAYGLDTLTANQNKAKKNVLVFDLGGGTFDVSLVTIQRCEIQVKAISGDTHLGGGDFDNNLVEYLLDEFKRKHKKDISENPRVRSRLRAASEKAKRVLSSVTETTIEIDCLYEGIDFTSTVTRSRFENLNKDLFRNCIDTVDKCLKDAKMEKADVHDVVLVGGSARIPKVQQLLQEFFDGIDLRRSINLDEAVAYGAAIHGAMLSGVSSSISDIVLVDVTPLSLGLKDNHGAFIVVIPRNTPLPVKKNIEWFTVEDNQTSIKFHVYQGERPVAEDNILLDAFTIYGLPPKPRGKTKFDVCFNIDSNGVLNVSAVELGTLMAKQVTITNHSGRLSENEIKRMLDDAKKYEAQDEKSRELLRAKHALENYAYDIVNYFRDVRYGDNVNAKVKVKEQIMTVVDSAFQLLETNSKISEVSVFEEKLRELQSNWRDLAF